MSKQKVKDTEIELAVRRELFRRGLRFRLQGPVVPGTRRKADLEFRTARVAVFVDGCFWHGCPDHGAVPKENRVWWAKKLDENRQRDDDSVERLSADGWCVIRIWEHESVDEAVDRVEEAARGRARPLGRGPTEIPENAAHGVLSTYSNYQCRCDACRAANAAYQRELIARYREQGGRGQHGTAYRYQTGCRCDDCRAAHAAADRQYRRSRKGSRLES
ncbi:MAG: very short patch repair endonuclease [Humibacillus sp.]|nr:very short patch repair endonuclease [Humibacillus sp.]MDN5777113.1 very short patch repair endonuclease [Humibacillus sp.]